MEQAKHIQVLELLFSWRFDTANFKTCINYRFELFSRFKYGQKKMNSTLASQY